MTLYDKMLAYFYALVLSFWSIAIPPGDFSSLRVYSTQLETSSDKISSIDPPENVFLVSPNLNSFTGSFPVDQLSYLDHFFNEHTFQFKYLQGLFATTFSFLKNIEVKFSFIDLIFPFHYFW